jgi:anti-anti-sigma regulatory factor
MTQHNLAFISGHARGSESLDAVLLAQVERYVAAGRRNIVVVLDTFPNLDQATVAALLGMLCRASELQARVTCVALDDRVVTALRAVQLADWLRIIRRVDELPGVA